MMGLFNRKKRPLDLLIEKVIEDVDSMPSIVSDVSKIGNNLARLVKSTQTLSIILSLLVFSNILPNIFGSTQKKDTSNKSDNLIYKEL
jgi:hypothetical protein